MPNTQLTTSIFNNFSNGDKAAFEIIYNHYQQVVFNNISKLILQEHAVEDILQDVFFKLWENKHKLQDEQSVAAWLFTVSYNQSINYIRHIIKEKKYLSFNITEAVYEQLNTTDFTAMDELKENIIADAIDQLPTRKKLVFQLCKLQGKTYAEAATIMGIAPDTVKEHLTIALKFVKSYSQNKYTTETLGALSIFSIYMHI